MSSRMFFTLPVTFAATLLHVGCCLVPVLSFAGTSLVHLDFFARYKLLITCFQLGVVLYLLAKIILDYKMIIVFCSAKDRLIHFASFLIATGGILISYYEPFKSENQRLAEQQFMLFKNHRQLEVYLSGNYDQEILRKDLLKIKGINRVRIENDTLALTFQSNQISSRSILRNLELKGYNIAQQ